MILRAKFQSVPNFFRFHRRTRAASADLDDTRRRARERKREQHRYKNARPFFVAAPPGDRSQRGANRKVFGPITQPAHVAHKILCHAALMLRDENLHRVIEVECHDDDDHRNRDTDQPIKNEPALHK